MYGMAKSIWDSIRYLNDQENVTYSQLLVKVKAATVDCNDSRKEMIRVEAGGVRSDVSH